MEGSSSHADTWTTAGSQEYHGQSYTLLEAFSSLDPTEGSGYDAVMDLIARCIEEGIPISEDKALAINSSDILGAGAAAEVVGGNFNGRSVAVKKFRFRLPLNPDSPAVADPKFRRMLLEAKMEIRIMANQFLHSHGNICRLFAVHFVAVQGGLQPMLILERAECTLSECLRIGKFASSRDRAKILSDIANGLEAIHNLGIVHGDLKPSNCLVFDSHDRTPVTKISDFGYSLDTYNAPPAQYRWGTRFWAAPECLDGPKVIAEHRNSSSRDVYSFGMIMVVTIFSAAALHQESWPSHDICEASDSERRGIASEIDHLKLDGKLESIAASLVSHHFQILGHGTSPVEDTSVEDLLRTILNDSSRHNDISLKNSPILLPTDLSRPWLRKSEIPRAVRNAGLVSPYSTQIACNISPHVSEEEEEVPLAYLCIAQLLHLDPRSRPKVLDIVVLFKGYNDLSKLDLDQLLGLQRNMSTASAGHLKFENIWHFGSQAAPVIPAAVGKYLFELTKGELERVQQCPHTAQDNRLSILLNNLAHCYHRAIGVEYDVQKSNSYTLRAARSGSYNARYFLLMRSSMKREPVLGLDLAERLDWTLEILLHNCPDVERTALQNALTFADDLQSSVDLCSYSLAGIFGRRYVLAVRHRQSTEVPSCVAEDNAMELRELLKARRTDTTSNEFHALVLDILEASIQFHNVQYSVLREILLWVDIKNQYPRVADAFSTCVKRGDGLAISIFINSIADAWRLIELNDIVQAAMVGCWDVICDLSFLLTLKLRMEAIVDTHETQKLENLSINKSIERGLFNDDAFTQKFIYQKVPTDLLNMMLQISILGNNWPTFNKVLRIEGVDLNEPMSLTMFDDDQKFDLGKFTPLQVSVLFWLPLFTVALLEKGAEITPIPGHFLPGEPEHTTLLHLICRTSYYIFLREDYFVFLADENCRTDRPVVGEAGKEALISFVRPDLGTWKTMVRILIQAGLEINRKDSCGFTPIRYLLRCDKGEESIKDDIRKKLEFLLELGASLDIAAELDSSYALHTCWLNKTISLDTIEFVVQNTSSKILDNGPAPFTRDKPTPMREASVYGSVPVCRALLRRGARLTVRDKVLFGIESPNIFPGPNGTTTFFQEVVIDDSSGLRRPMEAIFMHITVEQQTDEEGLMTILQGIIQHLNSSGGLVRDDRHATIRQEETRATLRAGRECIDPHLNSSDLVGRTRLHIAAQQNDAQALRLLLSEGALLSSKDWLGLTALHFAYATGNREIISMLELAQLSHQPEFTVPEPPTNTPLMPPSKMRAIACEGSERWTLLCRAYDDEMERRAELFPGTVVWETSDVFKVLNLDRSTFDLTEFDSGTPSLGIGTGFRRWWLGWCC